MTYSHVEQAARNNAVWCDTVCRSHGVPGEFHDSLWLNRHPVPRFYPNAVSLATQNEAVQLAAIQDLVATGPSGGLGVKDSFCSLDLAPLGFEPLFESMWLRRAPFQPLPERAVSGLRWTRVQNAPELAKWETAWSGNPANNSSISQPRLFLPVLLVDPELVFIVAYRDQKPVAGAIANHTDDVVGLSNIFAPPDDPVAFWVGCVAMVQKHFPGMPLVGYEHGQNLGFAQAVGFEILHPLKIWTW